VIYQKDTNDIDISNYYGFSHAPQSNKQRQEYSSSCSKIKNSVISRKIVHQPETISIYHPISDHYKVLGGG
jgi:hypothetical protein